MQLALRMTLALAVWLAPDAQIAFAQIPEKAREAFTAGHFATAAMLSEAEGAADALAFAARAHIADAITRESETCLDCLVRAEAAATAAIARDPDITEGYVQRAIAIGFRGRLIATLEAQSEGLAEKGRAAIDRALELDPANTWARASLGGWHLEIVHRAGSILAAVLYGADEDDGLENFRKAIAADPANILLQFNFALSLLALDRERFEDEAERALDEGVKDPRNDTLTQVMRARARKLADTLKSGTEDDVEALVRRYQGYPAD
jgi:tetratricopeptide (TPR) repeat protein